MPLPYHQCITTPSGGPLWTSIRLLSAHMNAACIARLMQYIAYTTICMFSAALHLYTVLDIGLVPPGGLVMDSDVLAVGSLADVEGDEEQELGEG